MAQRRPRLPNHPRRASNGCALAFYGVFHLSHCILFHPQKSSACIVSRMPVFPSYLMKSYALCGRPIPPYRYLVVLKIRDVACGNCIRCSITRESYIVGYHKCRAQVVYVPKGKRKIMRKEGQSIQNPSFLWMISGSSWYSSAETHICWTEVRQSRHIFT